MSDARYHYVTQGNGLFLTVYREEPGQAIESAFLQDEAALEVVRRLYILDGLAQGEDWNDERYDAAEQAILEELDYQVDENLVNEYLVDEQVAESATGKQG